ncbi:metal ABC transporter ATP-binding protein [Acidocella sp.]|uniref:metal ABC transporter ATP-binding protein n=1 Tax=Acidocella sp. TaxID=50710 RepID=UPI0026139348|nr:metal ABC transporter ATP-binding protein [Acidocella sp.]
MSAVLRLDRARVARGGQVVLEEVSFGLEAGAFCALIGANGAGKTSLMRAILGFERLAGGVVERQGPVGYVPQKLGFEPDWPVRARDFVALGEDGGRLGFAWPSKARRARVEAALAAVDGLGFAEQRVGELSGGQVARVVIAHALVRRPRLLLLDEPLANLDLRAGAELIKLLHRLSRTGVSVLLSAHDMNPLLPAIDRLVYLAAGHAVSGVPAEVVRTDVLSKLYGYHIDVIRVHGRILVVAGEPGAAPEGAHVAAVP